MKPSRPRPKLTIAPPASEPPSSSEIPDADNASPAPPDIHIKSAGSDQPADARQQPAAVIEFQSDAIELEERRPPRLAGITLYAVVLFIGAAIAWASLSQMDEIIVASGKLVTTKPLLVVQPLETSVVRTILVKPGDIVKAGQTLARLDPTFSDSDVEQIQAKIASIQAQLERLGAEGEGHRYVAPPGATPDQLAQSQLSAQRTAYYAAQLRNFDAKLASADASRSAAQDQTGVLTKRLAGLSEINQMKSSLVDTGSGSRLSLLQARDVSLDIESTLSAVRGTAAQSLHDIEQTNAERQTFIEDFRRQATENMVSLQSDLASAKEELKKGILRRSMAVMRAPADGAVLDIGKVSIGSVVQAAEPMFTLVPLNVPLEAEVSVGAKDIGQLAEGDRAKIKFDAFPFQKYGTQTGTVRTISQDSYAPQDNAASASGASTSFYKARIDLSGAKLKSLPSGFQLLPGMSVQAEVDVGQRSVISYFLYPLLRGLDESFHEP